MNQKETKKLGHIDIVQKYFYPVAAGIETSILETYSILVKNGWDVTIHTSKDTLTEKNYLTDKDKIRGIEVKRYSYKWYGYFPDINWGMTNLVSLHNFNIVPHFYVFLKALFLKITGKKNFALVLTPHGGFNPDWSIFSPIQRTIKIVYHYTIGVLLINICVDAVRTISRWEKTEMIKKGVNSKLIVVIDNGIESEAFEDVEIKASPEIKKIVEGLGNYIIQVGRIHPIKNYETTIKAFETLTENIKFVIVGPEDDNSYKKYLQELIEKLGLQNRVIFMGVTRGIDKYYLMKKAKMMVHMAIWESFCNVVHEGLSQGLVCIVANNSALPYLIKDGFNGYCVETRNYKEVAMKINFVFKNKDSELIRNMKKNSIAFGLKNSWEDVASNIHNLYKQLIDRSDKIRNKNIQKHNRISFYYEDKKLKDYHG
ncbi:MAG: glycosyltransferase family 4 protein [Nanoarchaeota archaeon]